MHSAPRRVPVSRALFVAFALVACSNRAQLGAGGANAGGGDGGDGATNTTGAGSPGDSADAGTVGGDGGNSGTEESIATELAAAITGHETTVDFTLILADEDGPFFTHSKGASTQTTSYESASTSKLVSSVIILSLVEQGYLSLDSNPQDFLPFWTSDAADPRSEITLGQLLSFTSGIQAEDDVACVDIGAGTLQGCVENFIYPAAAETELLPGEAFFYGSHHMQVAGLMAIEARGVDTWTEVFDEFKERTGLFANSTYDLPSAQKPRLAGGMHWTGNDYVEFLQELYLGALLLPETTAELYRDHTEEGAVTIVNSPVERGVGEAWHYALGLWRECASTTFDAACESLGRISSPGLYGAYPFIDFGGGYFGILARQGPLATFTDGLAVYRDLSPLVEELVLARR